MSKPQLNENSQTSSYRARRRQIIKTTAWVAPTVIAVNLPAHAQSTPVETTTSTTTSTTTTTAAPELCANVVIDGSVWNITSDLPQALVMPAATFNANGTISLAGTQPGAFNTSWSFDTATCLLLFTIDDLNFPGGLDNFEATVTIDPSGSSGSGSAIGTYNEGAPGESMLNGMVSMTV